MAFEQPTAPPEGPALPDCSGALMRLTRGEVGYSRQPLLPPVDIEVNCGEAWAVFGRNGAGKTTLVRSMLGLLPLVGGEVARRRGLRVTYVPQRGDYDLSVPTRVIDFVRGGLDTRWSFLKLGWAWAMKEAVGLALDQTDTKKLCARQFAELSEGQKQRVLIARAIVSDPELIVLDEPASAMDLENAQGIFGLLASLRRVREMGVILISHNVPLAARFASHGVLIDADHRLAFADSIDRVVTNEHFIEQFGVIEREAATEVTT